MTNDIVFMDMLSTLDPSLWRVKKMLLETKVNPDVMLPIIESIGVVYTSTKNGKIVVSMVDGVVVGVKGEVYRNVKIEATV